MHPTKGCDSLVPRPPPRFYLAAMKKSVRNFPILLHGCKIKSGQRPGNKARGVTHPVLPTKGHAHLCTHFQPFPYCCKELKEAEKLVQSISTNIKHPYKFLWAYGYYPGSHWLYRVYMIKWANQKCFNTAALSPGPAQFSVACSTYQRGELVSFLTWAGRNR